MLIVDSGSLEAGVGSGRLGQVVHVRRGEIGQNRAPQSHQLLVHGMWNVVPLHHFEQAVGAHANSAGIDQFLQQRGRRHISAGTTLYQ